MAGIVGDLRQIGPFTPTWPGIFIALLVIGIIFQGHESRSAPVGLPEITVKHSPPPRKRKPKSEASAKTAQPPPTPSLGAPPGQGGAGRRAAANCLRQAHSVVEVNDKIRP